MKPKRNQPLGWRNRPSKASRIRGCAPAMRVVDLDARYRRQFVEARKLAFLKAAGMWDVCCAA